MCDAVDTGKARFMIPEVTGEVRTNRFRVAPLIPYMGTRVLRARRVSAVITPVATLVFWHFTEPARTATRSKEEFIPRNSSI